MTPYPLIEFGGSGTVMHLAVANGFPPQTYLPLLRPFTDRYRVVSLPPRAMWQGEQPPRRRLEWDKTIGRDLLDGIRTHDLQNMVGIGHSFGGIATMLAANADPHRFKAVVMLDPTILPRSWLWMLRLTRPFGAEHQLVKIAQNRRTHFESVDAAYEYFKGKRLFADWSDESVRLYAETFVPDGEGVRLVWSNQWEAYYFRTIYTGSWSALRKLRDTGLPVLLVRGGKSDTLLEKTAARIRRILPNATYAEVPGHGHLFAQSAPDETRRIIEEWLETI